MTATAGWENFYVIVGSSAGALIGLQFVVITLIADMPIARGQAQPGDGARYVPLVILSPDLLGRRIPAVFNPALMGNH